MAIISTNFDANLFKILEVIVNYLNVKLQNQAPYPSPALLGSNETSFVRFLLDMQFK